VDRRVYPEKCARPDTTCLRRALTTCDAGVLAAAA
jgi:hypothetical protein